MTTSNKSPEEVIAECEAALAATDTKNPGRLSTHDAHLVASERRALRERIAVARMDAAVRDALTRPTPTPLARRSEAETETPPRGHTTSCFDADRFTCRRAPPGQE